MLRTQFFPGLSRPFKTWPIEISIFILIIITSSEIFWRTLKLFKKYKCFLRQKLFLSFSAGSQSFSYFNTAFWLMVDGHFRVGNSEREVWVRRVDDFNFNSHNWINIIIKVLRWIHKRGTSYNRTWWALSRWRSGFCAWSCVKQWIRITWMWMTNCVW